MGINWGRQRGGKAENDFASAIKGVREDLTWGLDVLGRREDGYHQVRMIMQTVGLHDGIDIYLKSGRGIRVESNLYYLPNNEQNLAYRAAALLMEEFGVDAGLSIRLRKIYPGVCRHGRGKQRCRSGALWREQDVRPGPLQGGIDGAGAEAGSRRSPTA